jgi:hypothetical protein
MCDFGGLKRDRGIAGAVQALGTLQADAKAPRRLVAEYEK